MMGYIKGIKNSGFTINIISSLIYTKKKNNLVLHMCRCRVGGYIFILRFIQPIPILISYWVFFIGFVGFSKAV